MKQEVIKIVVHGKTYSLPYFVGVNLKQELEVFISTRNFLFMPDAVDGAFYRPNNFKEYANIPLDQSTAQLHGYVNRSEFIEDIHFLVNSFNKQQNIEELDTFKAIDDICQNHIRRFGRLINTDMLTYIDELIHIIKAVFEVSAEEVENQYAVLSDYIMSKYEQYVQLTIPSVGNVKLSDYMKMMNETELLIEFGKCWNNLDISYIDNILDDNLEYTSQWVFETMYGKKEYLEYLDRKFSTIRDSINIPQAELGYFKFAYGEENKPCLVITQGDVKVAILTEIKNGKLSKINMVGVPPPNNAILFDFVPK